MDTFRCVVCQREVSEDKKVYRLVDWCEECIDRDGERMVRECSTSNPFIFTDLPYYITYGNNIPEALRLKLLAIDNKDQEA